jgi:drug/metabolite transporter superfamily protein YnfA
LGDGDYTVTLTKINYSLYSEVSFGLFTGIAGTISITINGQTCSSFVSDGFYVVEINGRNLNIHKMNEPANVLLTATLTDAQYNGLEALTLNVTESGWNSIQVSHILGALAVQEAEEPETPEESEVWGPVAISGVTEKITSNANQEGGQRIMTGAADNTYTFTLPEVKFSCYSEVAMITMFGQANTGYTFNAYGTTFVNTSVTWNWVKVIKVGAEGKTVKDTDTGADIVLSEGYYLTIGNTDVGSEWYKYVKLSDAVVNGEEALTFTVTTSEGAWDWIKFRQDGSVETDNFAGTLLA